MFADAQTAQDNLDRVGGVGCSVDIEGRMAVVEFKQDRRGVLG